MVIISRLVLVIRVVPAPNLFCKERISMSLTNMSVIDNMRAMHV